MTNSRAALVVVLLFAIAGAAIALFHKQNFCTCVGTCAPDPCTFMWDSKTGAVIWSKG